MNKNRKIQNAHITVKGHYMYTVPAYKRLFYCYEFSKTGQEHTHIGLQLLEPMSRALVIKECVEHHIELTRENPEINQLDGTLPHHWDVQAHPSFN